MVEPWGWISHGDIFTFRVNFICEIKLILRNIVIAILWYMTGVVRLCDYIFFAKLLN